MSISQRRLSLAAGLVPGLILLSACASGPGDSPAPTSTATPVWGAIEVSPSEGRVIGVGTVLDESGSVQLCLGAVMESYPPQCLGIPVDGWTWDGVDGSESSGATRWGSYAVYGTYDGERYTITDPPIMLALYDTVAPEDPTGGIDGTTADDELARIQDEVSAGFGDDALTLGIERGYLWVQVVWDDGTLQDAADDAYDEGVVIVTSALREID
ncbi:hypothetical protein [Microbacterium sp. NPDC089695]|uniref:hypothetical protein n=1 Tax=Microbacterium sp. NPDC089695 TaxID=3364198 RepID=UPI0038300C21